MNSEFPPAGARQHSVYIALGSNLGKRAANLAKAIQALAEGVQILAKSPVYVTPPWGYQEQPDFLNQVVAGETKLGPEELLALLKHIEARLGRAPTFRNGPRRIDLDILFYDDLVYETGNLSIPHPRLSERAFVLVPLADLAPELRHPLLKRTIRELLLETDATGIKLYSK